MKTVLYGMWLSCRCILLTLFFYFFQANRLDAGRFRY